jgi:hypothetical protein
MLDVNVATRQRKLTVVNCKTCNAVAFIAIDSSQMRRGADTFDMRKGRLAREAEECGLRIYRFVVCDFSNYPPDLLEVPPEFSRAGHIAVKMHLPLILDFGVNHPILQSSRAEWLKQGIEIIDREALDKDREILRNRYMTSGTSSGALAKAQRPKEGRAKKAGSPRDTTLAKQAAAETHSNDKGIRLKQFAVFFDRARADGAVTPGQIADWLNANSVATARGRAWTRQNVQRFLSAIERDKLTTEVHALVNSLDDLELAQMDEFTEVGLAALDEEFRCLGIMDVQEEDVENSQDEIPRALNARVEIPESHQEKSKGDIIGECSEAEHQESEEFLTKDELDALDNMSREEAQSQLTEWERCELVMLAALLDPTIPAEVSEAAAPPFGEQHEPVVAPSIVADRSVLPPRADDRGGDLASINEDEAKLS